jgi:RNA:NAD 2'-phosphotransferase (TPT1/KptA family)
LKRADIERLIDGQAGKIRYEFDGQRQRIRATHGHSNSEIPGISYEVM